MSATGWVLVTSNEHKWREAQRILGRELERVALELPELQAATIGEVALEKARAAFARLGRPVVVEDAGIELVAFGGFPGPFTRYWEQLGGLESICRAVDGLPRGVTAVCALGVCDGAGARVIEGRASGLISPSPVGSQGFGWDAIFIPEGETRTFGQMTAAEKDARSHRRRAWEALRTAP